MVRSLFALVSAALFAGCCGGGPGGDSVSLTGAGATFPYPLYTKWIAEHAHVAPTVAINYQSIGSGGGIRQITEKTVDFGASDAPMTDEQLAKAKDIIHVPTCLGAVVLTYNLEGITSGLSLRKGVIAGIFLGEIKEWNDPRILATNPNLPLPAKAITTIHRSDGSGTTKIFLDYLALISPAWASGPGSGTSVSWPVGLGAKGNEGVAGQIKSQPGSIGYVELSYAKQNKMAIANIENRAGKFIEPTLASTTLAASGAASKMPEDLRISIVDAEGEAAYPISGFTYILVHTRQQDVEKGNALAGFLRWALAEGQQFASGLSYAPLPPEVAEKAKQRLSKMVGPDARPLQ